MSCMHNIRFASKCKDVMLMYLLGLTDSMSRILQVRPAGLWLYDNI